MRVLVYGATGSQAGPIVPKLVAAGHTPVVITRTAAHAAAAAELGAMVVEADMGDLEALRAAHAGVEAVALMVPAFANPLEQPRLFTNALTAARDAGVGLIVYNTSGPLIAQRIGNPMYDSRHDRIEELRASGVPSIIIQPTAYMENLLGPWTRPGIVAKDELAYPTPPELRLGWIATDDVAALIVAALQRPQLAGSHFVVSGPENLSGPELAARFSAGLGRTITYREMPLDEFAALLDAAFGPGAGAGGAAGYKFQRDNADLIPMWADMAPVLQQLPVTLTGVDAWARQMGQAFAPATAAAPA